MAWNDIGNSSAINGSHFQKCVLGTKKRKRLTVFLFLDNLGRGDACTNDRHWIHRDLFSAEWRRDWDAFLPGFVKTPLEGLDQVSLAVFSFPIFCWKAATASVTSPSQNSIVTKGYFFKKINYCSSFKISPGWGTMNLSFYKAWEFERKEGILTHGYLIISLIKVRERANECSRNKFEIAESTMYFQTNKVWWKATSC